MSMKEVKKSLGDAATNIKDAAVKTEEVIAEKTKEAVENIRENSSKACHCAKKETRHICCEAERVAHNVKDNLVKAGATLADKTSEVAHNAASKLRGE